MYPVLLLADYIESAVKLSWCLASPCLQCLFYKEFPMGRLFHSDTLSFTSNGRHSKLSSQGGRQFFTCPVSFPSQKMRRGTSQHTSSCRRASRAVNRRVHPPCTKCSVLSIAPEGSPFWLVFIQNIQKSITHQKLFDAGNSVLYAFRPVDAWSPSTTAVAQHPCI